MDEHEKNHRRINRTAMMNDFLKLPEADRTEFLLDCIMDLQEGLLLYSSLLAIAEKKMDEFRKEAATEIISHKFE